MSPPGWQIFPQIMKLAPHLPRLKMHKWQGEVTAVAMQYALCTFDWKSHRTSTVPARTICNFKNMHFNPMRYNNFNCIGLALGGGGVTGVGNILPGKLPFTMEDRVQPQGLQSGFIPCRTLGGAWPDVHVVRSIHRPERPSHRGLGEHRSTFHLANSPPDFTSATVSC